MKTIDTNALREGAGTIFGVVKEEVEARNLAQLFLMAADEIDVLRSRLALSMVSNIK